MNRQPKGVQRTTVRLDPDTLRKLSDEARRQACTRSALVSRILRDSLKEAVHAAT
jgi:predicted transcriptional regulator